MKTEFKTLGEKISYQRWNKPIEIDGKEVEMIGFIEVKDVKETFRRIIIQIPYKNTGWARRMKKIIEKEVGKDLI